MKKRNILIIGHKGLIGKYLVNFYKNENNVNLVCVDKSENFDLTKKDLLSSFLKKNKNLNYIINASGKNSFCASIGILTFAISNILNVKAPPSAFELKYIPRIATSKIAEAPINIKVNFIAEYSFGPDPQIPISKYIGITATSKNKNIVNKSREIKNP